jgi:hypothetical protein
VNLGFALPYDICVTRVWVRKLLTEGRGAAPEWELTVDPFQNEVAGAVVTRFPQRLKPVQSAGSFTRPLKGRSSTVVQAFTVMQAVHGDAAFAVTRAITMVHAFTVVHEFTVVRAFTVMDAFTVVQALHGRAGVHGGGWVCSFSAAS